MELSDEQELHYSTVQDRGRTSRNKKEINPAGNVNLQAGFTLIL
jgi:hypothetical protein